MQRRATDELARLAASALDDLIGCPRRLADRLSPDHVPTPSSSLGFRASSRLLDIVVAAHDRCVTNGDALDDAIADRRATDALPSLSPEERFVVDRGLARYADAFSGTPVALDPRSGSLAAPRPSADGRFSLTGAVPILLAGRVGDEFEARRVVLRHRRSGAPSAGTRVRGGQHPVEPTPVAAPADDIDALDSVEGDVVRVPAAANPGGAGPGLAAVEVAGADRSPRTNDVALAALLRVDRLRVVRVWALGDATPEVSVVGPHDVSALRERLRTAVDVALTRDPPARPGRGCASCPAMRNCPEVPQHRLAPFASAAGAP